MERERAPDSVRGMAIGKYRVFASLGRGGMADVYLAVARGPGGFNKLTVIKRLRPDLSSDPTFAGMLLDEARLAARLNHPNIVHTYEVGESDGTWYIAMEYLEGQPLVRVARASSRDGLAFEAAFCARIVADALAGLHHAHELRDYDGKPLRIIHRDVSPHNIFITYDGTVKLMDFGIAKATSSSSQTEIGVLKGKVAYMAPEQARAEAIDRRADLFSMGTVLWELLTRQRLFHAGTSGATLHRLLLEPIPNVSERLRSIDPRLDAIVARALAKEPGDRFQTALGMRDELEAWIAASGVLVSREEIGLRTSEMFEETHQRVHRQIQIHMAELNRAESAGELLAVSAGSLGNIDTGGAASDRKLTMLGSSSRSRSGSGSDLIPMATPGSIRAPAAVPQRGKPGVLAWASAAGLALVAAAFVAVRASPFGQPSPSAARGASELHANGEDPNEDHSANPTSESPGRSSSTTGTVSSGVASTPTVIAPSRAPSSSSVDMARPKTPAAHAPSPRAVARLEGLPAATDGGGTGYLTFDTYPWTRVSENGRPLGTTPLVRLPLSSGTHLLVLENDELGIHQSYAVTLKPEEALSRRLGLK